MTRHEQVQHAAPVHDSHAVVSSAQLSSQPQPSTSSSPSSTTATAPRGHDGAVATMTAAAAAASRNSDGNNSSSSSDDGEAVSIRSLHMRRDWYTSLATFVAGGVAGASSRTLTAPLDRMKILVQEGHLVGHSPALHSSSSGSCGSSGGGGSGVHAARTSATATTATNAAERSCGSAASTLRHAATTGAAAARPAAASPLASSSCANVCARTAAAAAASSSSSCVPRRNASLLEAARLIVADGGWRSFWRGNLVNCFKAGPEFAIVFTLRRYLFSLYEDCIAREQQEQVHKLQLQLQLQQHTDEPQRRQLAVADGVVQRVPLLIINCTIGAVAGLVAQSVLYPMELVKTRVVVSRTSEYTGGVRAVVRAAYRVGGVREFFRGFAPNMVGIIVYRGLEMGLYSSTQQSLMLYRMKWQHKSRHDAALSTAEVGAVGMFASMIAQTVSYPLNVVRTRLQTQGVNGRHRAYHGMLDCFAKMVRHAGVRSLFSGLSANYLKAVPASACTFIVFEKMQALLVGDN